MLHTPSCVSCSFWVAGRALMQIGWNSLDKPPRKRKRIGNIRKTKKYIRRTHFLFITHSALGKYSLYLYTLEYIERRDVERLFYIQVRQRGIQIHRQRYRYCTGACIYLEDVAACLFLLTVMQSSLYAIQCASGLYNLNVSISHHQHPKSLCSSMFLLLLQQGERILYIVSK